MVSKIILCLCAINRRDVHFNVTKVISVVENLNKISNYIFSKFLFHFTLLFYFISLLNCLALIVELKSLSQIWVVFIIKELFIKKSCIFFPIALILSRICSLSSFLYLHHSNLFSVPLGYNRCPITNKSYCTNFRR